MWLVFIVTRRGSLMWEVPATEELLAQEMEYPCLLTGLDGCHGKIVYAGFGLSVSSSAPPSFPLSVSL